MAVDWGSGVFGRPLVGGVMSNWGGNGGVNGKRPQIPYCVHHTCWSPVGHNEDPGK